MHYIQKHLLTNFWIIYNFPLKIGLFSQLYCVKIARRNIFNNGHSLQVFVAVILQKSRTSFYFCYNRENAAMTLSRVACITCVFLATRVANIFVIQPVKLPFLSAVTIESKTRCKNSRPVVTRFR